ncbi:MAG: hypothetical protein FJ405_01400 [Verrucomicrobia bacterium]|nr:hypothetical protein [Verrucomicrobiota bacterium]
MNLDDLEKRMAYVALRHPPEDLQRAVLDRARTSHLHTAPHSASVAAPAFRLRDLFWPAPKAWGALAAAWVFILVLNWLNPMEPATESLSPDTSASSADREALVLQRQFYAELLDLNPRSSERQAPKGPGRPAPQPPRPQGSLRSSTAAC